MKVHLLSEQLQKRLSFLNHAVSTKSQLPILLNFLLETKDNELTISATDLEIGIQTKLKAEGSENGGITVPAKLFSELIASLPTEKISLETKGELLIVSSKKTRSTFQTIAKDEFPSLYQELGEKIHTFSKEVIEKELAKIVFSASTDVTRPALSAVLMKKESSDSLILVATDGYRLSLKRFTLSTDQKAVKELEKPLLIPSRAMREIIGIKEETDGVTLYISKTSNQVLFTQGGTTVVARLIEAEFPNYDRIIPTESATHVEFDRQELQKAVKTCSIFARETANIIKIAIKKSKSDWRRK